MVFHLARPVNVLLYGKGTLLEMLVMSKDPRWFARLSVTWCQKAKEEANHSITLVQLHT